MTETRYMPEATETVRMATLQDTADKIRKESYDAPLSDAEIDNRKANFFKNAMEIEELEDAKKEIAAEFTEKIKNVKAKNREIRNEIKTGATKQEGVLYDVPNYDNGYMETFDKTGELIEKRRLTPAEKNGLSNMYVKPA